MRGARGGLRSSAVPLAVAWSALIVYASLFPFDGWRWPPGVAVRNLLPLPWPHYFIAFDITSNLLAYAPLGLLVCVARLRHGAGLAAAMFSALLLGAVLSYTMEVLQHLLPQRVPSLLDWLLNTAGAALGALLAALCERVGLLRWWHGTRERWLEHGNGGALALLVLWPVALLFPKPVPLGVGQAGPALRGTLLDILAGVPWAEPLAQWLEAATPATRPLSSVAEATAVVLGMLSPCLLAFTAARPGWRRLGLVAGVLAVAAAATSLSTVLNFGPQHGLAWGTPAVERALAVATGLALAGLWLRPRLAGALALVALTGLVMLVHMAPTDPYFAESLQGWEQGRFVRFHGLAQWVGWLWPYMAIGWLLARLGAR